MNATASKAERMVEQAPESKSGVACKEPKEATYRGSRASKLIHLLCVSSPASVASKRYQKKSSEDPPGAIPSHHVHVCLFYIHFKFVASDRSSVVKEGTG
jgi:hypothetical protein